MQKITLELPDEIFISLKETPEEFAREMRMLVAVKLYQMNKLSSGRSAELAGILRVSFLQFLSKYDVPIFDLTENELKEDIENA